MSSNEDVTQLLVDWRNGDPEALDRLLPVVYDELRRLARGYLGRERSDHTLAATALVNEAFLRLIDQRKVQWQGRSHFFGIAAQMMRRILVDHARQHNAGKRGGAARKLALDEALALSEEKDLDLVALDDALKDLAALDPRQSRIVELRFFGGLDIEETAEALEISPATVKREWNMAKAWLYRQISRREAG
jgi:RNA polymerase sigma factor (TIGR02999 family)